mmetsp:Transcript_721/g.1576  ORF Transcript_721/g.1576 Transcript_721/m.1576 type:complete len:203 (-) Transcript_721:441-1049(-)
MPDSGTSTTAHVSPPPTGTAWDRTHIRSSASNWASLSPRRSSRCSTACIASSLSPAPEWPGTGESQLSAIKASSNNNPRAPDPTHPGASSTRALAASYNSLTASVATCLHSGGAYSGRRSTVDTSTTARPRSNQVAMSPDTDKTTPSTLLTSGGISQSVDCRADRNRLLAPRRQHDCVHRYRDSRNTSYSVSAAGNAKVRVI